MRNVLLILFKKVFKILCSILIVLIILGQMFWLALYRSEEYYLRSSIRNQATLSFWINQSGASVQREWLNFGMAHFSVWFQPKMLKSALSHFDIWAQEYALLREATEEAVEDESYALPPSILPDSLIDESYLADPYDLAFQNLVEDIWNSGFLSAAGSVHLVTPIWAQPFMGWMSADPSKESAIHVFDSKVSHSGIREDGADLLSWFSELLFAHLEVNELNGLTVHESVFELGGEQISSLHTRLCELGNLSETYCEISDLQHNPLDPFLYVTEKFRAQLKIYWALRGEHLIWASTKPCLLLIIEGDLKGQNGCAGEPNNSKSLAKSWQKEKLLNSSFPHKKIDSSGFLLNQKKLSFVFQSVSEQLRSQSLEGASWLFDFIQSHEGESFLGQIEGTLVNSALLKPMWGARLSWVPPEQGLLVTFADFQTAPGRGEQIQSEEAEKLFDFMYGWLSAWQGIPRGAGRLEKTFPWSRQQGHWEAVSEYSLGWREIE